jgi:CreA protein
MLRKRVMTMQAAAMTPWTVSTNSSPGRVARRAAAAGRWALLALGCAAAGLASAATGEKIGTVDTAFQWVGRDHDIIVEAYDDPGVQGITCYVSRARIGGIKGTLGLAEDRAEASIACRQVGPLVFPEPLRKQEEVFSERMSLLFKRLRVVRMVDATRNTLIYLTYSDKLVEGSPQNSLTAVPVDRATVIPLRK